MIKFLKAAKKFIFMLPALAIIAVQLAVSAHFHADENTAHDQCVCCQIATETLGEDLPSSASVPQPYFCLEYIRPCEFARHICSATYTAHGTRSPPVI